MEQQTSSKTTATRAVVAAIFGVFLVFLVILSMGTPTAMLDNRTASAAYAVAVFIPVAAVCLLALARSSKVP